MRAASVLLLVLLISSAALAEMLRFDFTGVVTGMPSGIFAGVAPGTAITGFYRYDTELVVSPGGDPSQSASWFGFANPARVWEVEIQAGGVTRGMLGSWSGGASPWPFLALTDDPTTDAFSLIIGQVGSANDDQAVLTLSDTSPAPPDGVAPGSGSLGSSVPTAAPDPSLFDACSCSYIARNPDGTEIGAVSFELTGIAGAAAVPSLRGPGLVITTLLLIGAAGATLWRRGSRRAGDTI